MSVFRNLNPYPCREPVLQQLHSRRLSSVHARTHPPSIRTTPSAHPSAATCAPLSRRRRGHRRGPIYGGTISIQFNLLSW